MKLNDEAYNMQVIQVTRKHSISQVHTHSAKHILYTYRTRHCSVSLPPTTSGGTRRISKAMTRRSFTISFVGLIPIFFTLPATVDAPASHCTSQQWNDLMVGSSSSRVESRRFLPESICLMESIFCCLPDAWFFRFVLAQQLGILARGINDNTSLLQYLQTCLGISIST